MNIKVKHTWSTILFFNILFVLINNVTAFYGDYNSLINYPSFFSAASFSIEETVYILGGRNLAGAFYNSDTWKMTFLANNSVTVDKVSPNGTLLNCNPCAGYKLSDNNTIALINANYNNTVTNSNLTRMGLSFYNVLDNIYSQPQYFGNLPYSRQHCTFAISPNNDAIFVIGGAEYGEIKVDTKDIYRYDLKNTSSVTNLTATNENLSLYIIGGSSDMLPDGKIVISFGFNRITGEPYPTNNVLIFDTNTNTIYNQTVNGPSPPERSFASSSLGSDKATIYYYGGIANSYWYSDIDSGGSFNKLVILNTTSWEWIGIDVPGFVADPYAGGTLTLIDSLNSSKLVYAGGGIGSLSADTIGVLINVPKPGQSLSTSGLKWFTNNPDADNLDKGKGYELSESAKIGISIGVIIFVIIILILSYIYFPPAKRAFAYIQNEMIWNPRSGEPFWAETSRLLVRFILLFLFIAFATYLIIKAVNSPIVIQQKREKVDSVMVPDARFCFSGFDPAATLNIGCQFHNNTDCSQYIIRLNMTVYTPKYFDFFGDIACFLFLPGPSFRLVNNNGNNNYLNTATAKMVFKFTTDIIPNITEAVIYTDFYAPGYDGNTVFYNLLNETVENNQDDIERKNWYISDQSANNVENSFIVKPTVRSTASFSIIEQQTLTDSGWNYIGLFTLTDTILTLQSTYRDSPQNPDILLESNVLSELTIQPLTFTHNVNIEQKVFTLLNALAQAGGVFGLIVAVQTLLFGFRPQSPWGIIHRWSFGNLRHSLTNRLANQFDKLGTTVPLVNPVNRRLSGLFRDSLAPNLFNPNVSSWEHYDEAASQEERVIRVEERLQLMEVVLKSYYLNDEIFRSIDQAVKRNNQEKRRNTLGGITPKDNDSVLENAPLNEEVEIETDESMKRSDISNVQRRPSSTVFNRNVYQPRLSSPDN